MKKAYGISTLCILLFLFMAGSTLAATDNINPDGGVYTAEHCANPEIIDSVNCCNREADEATRVDTARSILMVNGRIEEGGEKNDDHYHDIINFWAVNGSGEDGVGYDGPVYKESTLGNNSRQEMWDY